ncbi:hypothetical protein D3C73_860270 [compost metagenome]
MKQVQEVTDRRNNISRRNVFYRLVNVAVRDDFYYFTVFDRREYIDRLKRYIFSIKHTVCYMIGLKAYAIFQVRNNLVKQTTVNHFPSFSNNFTCRCIDQ